jgi:PAS domain S-box-containing protein
MGYDERAAENAARAAFNNPTQTPDRSSSACGVSARKVNGMQDHSHETSASANDGAHTQEAMLLAQEQHARRLHEDRFRAAASASSDLLWITTPDGRVLEASPTLQAFTGQTLADALGRGWLSAIHPDDREQLDMTRIQTLTTGQVYEVECRICRVDGVYRLVLVRGVLVRGSAPRCSACRTARPIPSPDILRRGPASSPSRTAW